MTVFNPFRDPAFLNFFSFVEPGQPKLVPMTVTETAVAYEATYELPGMSKEDIHIELSNGILAVWGEKKQKKSEDKVLIREGQYGAFRRELTLPEGVDAEKISASYENGVLKITLNKVTATPKKSRVINVT